ncbi:MAG: folylpolyglutamate synthase/dihydrofolate synthase family protein [Prevotella sp.]|uniref:bifunctional folylpolyglutamate synthase/dihydrofolate synthase n=1 Tax=Prevotella sp. TaxID=59823 RepID=UPI002A2592A4|nr:folylpolyglutamate synthase/dihydrofolate synthase family protein [Prevotella sp.]MDD7317553.1 bifunctional folylpolyglutamate synthase/dihydrofolate synthase [Prevotellaceae bacterium]MDY4020600.1 folylpolyglutamate synthase/dihydrofolate synthase family protein [Prevotella sp.]
MTYEKTVKYLYDSVPMFQNVGAAGYKEGLQNTMTLDEHFGHPHRRFRTIHVAGTNGKGSCSHTIAAMLQSEGYRVGLYTSPHLVDFRERIRINGKCIGKQYVIDFMENERAFFEPLHPSFFELTTALAFKYFAEERVDFAVIEVGLGGRLDCTNIISPELCIITNISLDHTQFLGDTLAKIATEKAGIIKHATPVVIGETTEETKPVFVATAERNEAPVFFAENENIDDYEGMEFELKGSYQQKNRATILCAARQLGISREAIRKGLATVCEATGLTGRWQTLGTQPLVICDTGHNAGGWQYLAQQIRQVECSTRRIVFGMVDDKDIDAVMSMLPQDAIYYWTQAETKRAVSSTAIMEKGRGYGLSGTHYPTVSSAYRAALADADATDFIFVGGSSYVVADLLTEFAPPC